MMKRIHNSIEVDITKSPSEFHPSLVDVSDQTASGSLGETLHDMYSKGAVQHAQILEQYEEYILPTISFKHLSTMYQSHYSQVGTILKICMRSWFKITIHRDIKCLGPYLEVWQNSFLPRSEKSLIPISHFVVNIFLCHVTRHVIIEKELWLALN